MVYYMRLLIENLAKFTHETIRPARFFIFKLYGIDPSGQSYCIYAASKYKSREPANFLTEYFGKQHVIGLVPCQSQLRLSNWPLMEMVKP